MPPFSQQGNISNNPLSYPGGVYVHPISQSYSSIIVSPLSRWKSLRYGIMPPFSRPGTISNRPLSYPGGVYVHPRSHSYSSGIIIVSRLSRWKSFRKGTLSLFLQQGGLSNNPQSFPGGVFMRPPPCPRQLSLEPADVSFVSSRDRLPPCAHNYTHTHTPP